MDERRREGVGSGRGGEREWGVGGGERE